MVCICNRQDSDYDRVHFPAQLALREAEGGEKTSGTTRTIDETIQRAIAKCAWRDWGFARRI